MLDLSHSIGNRYFGRYLISFQEFFHHWMHQLFVTIISIFLYICTLHNNQYFPGNGAHSYIDILLLFKFFPCFFHNCNLLIHTSMSMKLEWWNDSHPKRMAMDIARIWSALKSRFKNWHLVCTGWNLGAWCKSLNPIIVDQMLQML